MNFEVGDSVYSGFKVDTSTTLVYYRGDIQEVVFTNTDKRRYNVLFDDETFEKKMIPSSLTRVLPVNAIQYEKNKIISC